MISIKSLSLILAREKQASSDAAADQSLVSVRQSQSSPDCLSGSLSSVITRFCSPFSLSPLFLRYKGASDEVIERLLRIWNSAPTLFVSCVSPSRLTLPDCRGRVPRLKATAVSLPEVRCLRRCALVFQGFSACILIKNIYTTRKTKNVTKTTKSHIFEKKRIG
ncbi:hypothetical protein Cal7507_5007 [Calothrix sp. PCC 7507]|nr:hypothetical protein Cal7507_5007 [Calothrix sp. PCC 7507]